VRVKAVRDETGLPLEVYTGSDLEHLRLLADNRGRFGKYGMSGFIRLMIVKGQTYYFRTDVRPDQLITGTPYGEDSKLVIEPARSPLAGEVNFSFLPRMGMDLSGRMAIARAYAEDGRTRLVGTHYRARLYAGRTPIRMFACGTPRSFFPEEMIESLPTFAGLFEDAPVTVPVYAGQRVWVQVRVWDAFYGETFFAAMENGSPIGTSEVFPVYAGSEAVGPSALTGVGNIILHTPTEAERRLLRAYSVEPASPAPPAFPPPPLPPIVITPLPPPPIFTNPPPRIITNGPLPVLPGPPPPPTVITPTPLPSGGGAIMVTVGGAQGVPPYYKFPFPPLLPLAPTNAITPQ
jgi:hypothetical protein